MEWSTGQTMARWAGGGLWVRHRADGLLVDAPPGVVRALREELPRLRALVLTGGRISSVGGLVPLLDALVPHRDGAPLGVHTVLGEERGVALAETWARAWGSPFPITLDAERPGARLDIGPFEVELVPMKAGEPDVRGRTVRSRVQVAVRVHTPDALVAFVPGAAPGTAVGRACASADLAVVEVGVTPWPPTEVPWRLSRAEALMSAGDAGHTWLVGDDGESVEENLA